jgi:hypothetical protein
MLAVLFYAWHIPTIDFVILASAAVVYAVLQRRYGKWAPLRVFLLAWLCLLANADAFSLLEYNSIATILRHLAPGATVKVVFMLAVMLWAQRGAAWSRGKLLAWGVGGAAGAAYLVPVIAIVTLGNIPSHHPCNLPSLESTVPSRAIEQIGAERYFEDTCPVPVATEIVLERPYGSIRMKWWGSPHRLYMVGEATDGSPLRFGGSRVEEYRPNTPGTFLDAFSHRITFNVENYVGNPPPEAFAIEVFGAALEPLERLDLRYVPQRCTCATYDSL